MVVSIESGRRKERKMIIFVAIGLLMGHEITHGFDDDGRQFDKDGNKIPWWTDETVDAFNNQKTCIIQQYSNYTLAQVDEQVAYYFSRLCEY
jgi:predicted metalloendopeptidase